MMRYWMWGAALALLVNSQMAFAQDAAPPQRYALLIAVNDYTHLSDLLYCDNDQQALQQACLQVGFPKKNVILMCGQTERQELLPFRNNVVQQLRVLLAGVRQEDLVVVAFSGHGVHLNGGDYFCTIDSKLADPTTTMVAVKDIEQMLEKCPAQQKLLVIDACRNDPLPQGTRAAGEHDLVTSFQRSLAKDARDQASRGFAVMASCAEEQVSVEDADLEHGVFMNFVVNGILGHADANRDKQVSLLELHAYAEYETRSYVRSTRSMLQTPNLRGNLLGNYILANVTARPTTLDLQPVQRDKSGKGPSAIEMKLYDQAYGLLQQGKADEAVREFEQLLSVADDEQLKKVVRVKLASTYLALDPVANISRALDINRKAGMEAVSVVVQSATADIKLGTDVKRSVSRGQVLAVDKIADGGWYRVKSVDGATLKPEEVGYVYQTSFLKPRPVAAVATDTSVAASQDLEPEQNYGYGYGGQSTFRDVSGEGTSGLVAETPADAAAIRDIDRRYEQLDRLERWGASEATLRAKEREIMRKEEELERRQEVREAIRDFFNRGR